MEKEKKTEKLLLRLTPTDKKNVSYHAKLMNVSVNEYISLTIRRKRIVICENFPELIYQLSKIGNNINQIATIANTNQYISVSNVGEVQKIMEKCYKLLEDFISFIAEPEKDYLQNDTAKMAELLEQACHSIQAINSRLVAIENKIG